MTAIACASIAVVFCVVYLCCLCVLCFSYSARLARFRTQYAWHAMDFLCLVVCYHRAGVSLGRRISMDTGCTVILVGGEGLGWTIGTDTGCAGYRWAKKTVCFEHTRTYTNLPRVEKVVAIMIDNRSTVSLVRFGPFWSTFSLETDAVLVSMDVSVCRPNILLIVDIIRVAISYPDFCVPAARCCFGGMPLPTMITSNRPS